MSEIVDKYKLFTNKILGCGSFSTVYLGKCLNNTLNINNKYVAIKKVNRKYTKNIKNEIEIASIIIKNPHPNIVKYYDIVQNRDNIFFIMEYCEYGDLHDLIKGSIKEKYVKKYMSDIINGIQYLIKHNIHHQDIKPKNILVTNSRRSLKIADFGLATINEYKNKHKKTPLRSKTYSVTGSPLYMAPEVLNRKSYSNNSTIWALGMIMYELLFGIHPYSHCEDIEELSAQLYKHPVIIPPINSNNPDLSEECLDLLRSILELHSFNRIKWRDLTTNSWLNNTEINKVNSLGPEFVKSNEDINYITDGCFQLDL